MGSSSDAPIQLRYQTGRFAHSAKIQGVSRLGRYNLRVQYSYMRYPYDTFLPGGNLYKPERDPRGIISTSIREIATSILYSKFKVSSQLI